MAPIDPARPLDGRVALVTGAGSGIGRASALRLAQDGCTWVGCLDRDVAAARKTVAAIEGGATAIEADVTDAPAVGNRIGAFVADHGPVGIVVNNAGIPGGGAFLDVSYDDWRHVMGVHVDGAFHVTQAVLPGMIAASWGRVINIASESIWLGNQSVQYVTAKAALVGFTRSLAYQLAPHGVLVNAVAPGPVDTPMLRNNEPDAIEAELGMVRIGRFIAPEEVARTVAFLAGPGGDVFVGQVLSPNGGTVFAG